jgi:F0F1-type ATP synthase membrane subunit b/b'
MSDRNDPITRPDDPADTLRRDADRARREAGHAGEELREAAAGIAAEASATARTLRTEGEAVLEGARARAEDAARDGVRQGARQVGGVARAIHRAADELVDESPELARSIHDAAGRVDRMARAMRERSPGDLLRSAEDFARRQPLMFFGAATLAGFAMARFARASAAHAHPRHRDMHSDPQPGDRARPGMAGMPAADDASGWERDEPVSPQGNGPLVAAEPGESVTYRPSAPGGA